MEKITRLSQQCYKEIDLYLLQKSILKNEIFINQGSAVNTEMFLSDGIIRAYFVDDQGNEKSTAFYQGEAFISTSALRSKNSYSIYTYQALTDISIYTINSKIFSELINKYPELMKAAKYVKEKETERLNRRDECLMQVSALEKYRNFIEYYPKIENIIPHYYIASYLGITPVTLSRIRSSKMKK